MTPEPSPIWAYTASGRARVFDDGVIPPGWSADISVLPEDKRTGDYVSAADFRERVNRVPVDEPATEDDADDMRDPAPRRRGRPPNSARVQQEAGDVENAG